MITDMNSDRSPARKRARRDEGPQGTRVFSREEVDRLLDEAVRSDPADGGAELRGLSETVSGQSFALDSGRILVGRASRCAIRIDETSVSSEHARLVNDRHGWRVVNLLSTNGTFVNGRKVSNADLHDGDQLCFGRVEFTFHDPGEGRARAAGGGKRLLGWGLAVVAVALAGLVAWLGVH